jgi:uncharacterized membrane protein YgaE (UPF0421/DUF939 family)
MIGDLIRILFVIAFGLQLFLCMKLRKVWIKLLPTLTMVLFVALCFLAYGFSGWTNWAYLILLVPFLTALGADTLARIVCGIVELIASKKIDMLSRKNT